jgi:transporter family protein
MNTRAILLTAAVITLWGVWACFGRAALLRGMPPFTLFAVEVLASLAVDGVAFGVFSEERDSISRGWNFYGVISGTALGLGLLLYYRLLQKAPASTVVPLTSTYPVVATLLAFVLLHERPRPFTWVGIILVTLGVALIIANAGGDQK